MAKRVPASQREQLAAALEEALAGRGVGSMAWLYRLVLKAGFAPADFARLRGKDIAGLWNVSAVAVSKWWRHGGFKRNADKSWDLGAVIRWREEGLERESDVIGNNTSPALERWREENAAMAALRRQVMEDTLVPVDEMKLWLGRLALILRNAQEVLQRSHGDDAADIVREAISDWEAEIEKEWLKSENETK